MIEPTKPNKRENCFNGWTQLLDSKQEKTHGLVVHKKERSMKEKERKVLKTAIILLESAYMDINQQMGIEIRTAIDLIKWALEQ